MACLPWKWIGYHAVQKSTLTTAVYLQEGLEAELQALMAAAQEEVMVVREGQITTRTAPPKPMDP